jgi:two-component system OmpR family sensor kinase
MLPDARRRGMAISRPELLSNIIALSACVPDRASVPTDMDEDTMLDSDSPATAPQRLLTTLERLLDITAPDVKGALTEASDLIVRAIGADKADVFLRDPATETLVAVGTSRTPMGRRQQQIGLDRLPLANGGRTVAVFQTGVSYRTGRADEDPDELVGITRGLGIRSIITAPLEVDGVRRGALQVDATAPDLFSPDDQRFLDAVARWVGMVLHRAELGERIAREAAAQARRVAAEELVTVLAHDLRTPLTPLTGYLTLLHKRLRKDGRSKDVEYVEQATLAAARLQRMTADLLDAGRLDQGIFALSLQPVDLVDLTRETATMLRTPDAPIDVRAPDELVIQADPDRLRQALENLIGNALAHSPAGVPVVVAVAEEARDDGAWAVLAVRDEGPGIPPARLPTLFDRFARGSASTGLGLGLYLARGIAAAHGGTLTVDSTMGAGTTFRLSVPPSCRAS